MSKVDEAVIALVESRQGSEATRIDAKLVDRALKRAQQLRDAQPCLEALKKIATSQPLAAARGTYGPSLKQTRAKQLLGEVYAMLGQQAKAG